MEATRHSSDVRLVQLFVPLYSREGQPFPSADFATVRTELTDQFGGVTCFLASPAQGRWEDPSGQVQRDELVLYEVMTEHLDARWWQNYRAALEQRFHQDCVVVRALGAQLL